MSSEVRNAPEPSSYIPFAAVFTAAIALLPLLLRLRHGRRTGLRQRRGIPLRRRRSEIDGRLSALDLVELGVATYAASHIVVKDRVGRFIREPLIEHAEQAADEANGGGAVSATNQEWQVLGELVRCTRCAGAWTAASLTYLRLLAPTHGRIALHVLTAVGANNFLQAAFRRLRLACARAERELGGDDALADAASAPDTAARQGELSPRAELRPHEYVEVSPHGNGGG